MSGMTDNERKQQLSIAYVHAVAARAGYACQLINVDDDSIDVQLAARGVVHEKSILRSPRIDVQLKATARQPTFQDDHLDFPLSIKNYDDLRAESLVPRILVVLLLPVDEEAWLTQSEDEMIIRRCAYWTSLVHQPETGNRSSVSVRVPRSRLFSVSELRDLMAKVSRKEGL
ncbi:MAG: DUF4365 domain-containing protein [Isosphaeraceae bacterium]|nr:DUF4365 domain-containing protein [Isosphaeraceae bacterium]